jgi:AraC-like DNA-binding protein
VGLPHIQMTSTVDVTPTPGPGFRVSIPPAGRSGTVHSPGDASPPPEPGWIILHIDRSALENELAGMVGPVDEALRFQPGLDPTRVRVRAWIRLATAVATEPALLSRLDSETGLLDHPLVAPHLERVLLRALLLCQPNTYTERLHDDRRGGRPSHVDAAVRVMEERPQRAFTTTGLAREVGVSARTLQDGFRQHLGVSPMQFLRDARLRRVRIDLLAAEPDSGTTVSETAFRWGFTHLGRFASYYRTRYGESPSQTLRAPP